MKSTREMIEVMEAYERGEEIECLPMRGGEFEWWTAKSPGWDWPRFDYRIKPKAQYRPWKPEEVPVGALLRDPDTSFESRPSTVILVGRGSWVHFVHPDTAKLTGELSEILLKNHWEHSTDGGKTWKVCGVRA